MAYKLANSQNSILTKRNRKGKNGKYIKYVRTNHHPIAFIQTH